MPRITTCILRGNKDVLEFFLDSIKVLTNICYCIKDCDSIIRWSHICLIYLLNAE